MSDSIAWAFVLLGLLLTITNAAQFWFWSRQNQALIDKLMSRNYAEYVQTSLAKESAKTIKVKVDAAEETEDELKILNQQLGF